MKIKDTLKPTQKPKLDKVLIVALVLVLLSVVVYLLIKNFQTKPTSTTDITQLTQREFINIDNSKQITTSNATYLMPDKWQVIAAYKNPKDAAIKCVTLSGATSTDECIVYDISDGTNTFYASLKAPVLDNQFGNNLFNTNKISFLGESKEMFVQNLDVVTRTDESEGGEAKESDSIYVKQSYICASNNLCFSSGILTLDLTQNAKDFETFKQFIASIKLQ